MQDREVELELELEQNVHSVSVDSWNRYKQQLFTRFK